MVEDKSKSENITEDEAALYDRQIRLWGLDSQKRIRAAKVLIAGVCGLGAEVVKNLVLSGVKSVTLLDNRMVTEIDVCSNFLAQHKDIGRNVAESSQERSQNLNPMVLVTAEEGCIDDKTEEYFKQFDVVCLFHISKELLEKVDNICRTHDIIFYCGAVFGMLGYLFMDLNCHEYAEEMKTKSEVEENGKSEILEEVRMVKKTEKFISLTQALDIEWQMEKYQKQLKKTSPMYFIVQILYEFYALHHRLPNPLHRMEDEVELLTIKNSLLPKLGVSSDFVSDDFSALVFGQVSPVCAIVGGILAQEVIKAVSHKDQPHNNFFFYSTLDGAGVIEYLGY